MKKNAIYLIKLKIATMRKIHYLSLLGMLLLSLSVYSQHNLPYQPTNITGNLNRSQISWASSNGLGKTTSCSYDTINYTFNLFQTHTFALACQNAQN